MGSVSTTHWLLVLVYVAMIAAFFIALVRIQNWAGFGGWWSVLSIIPAVNIVMLWKFSRTRWPAMDR
ncbi:hypothetical protein [Bradyrhizobium sp. SYSU BS000235]|uniref:hypothetical protein n=1 Tax=Bradyrhizobium sp. SYSU BS000235 TaxID=3411332 RepID=UPI003C77FF94